MGKDTVKTKVLTKLLAISILGLSMCFLSEIDKPFNLWLSMFLFSAAVIFGLKIKFSKFSFLTRFMVVLYALPFIHCFEYLFNPNIFSADRIWGALPNPYNTSIEIITRMAMNGCIGMLGLVAGYLVFFFFTKRERTPDVYPVFYRPLTTLTFTVFAVVSVFLVMLHVPRETLFLVGYTKSYNVLSLIKLDFSGAELVSHALAALLFVDALHEERPRRRKIKIKILGILFFFVVVWFGFLRGGRDWIGLIFGVMSLYIMHMESVRLKNFIAKYKKNISFNRITKKTRRTFVKIIILAMLVVISAQILGAVRHVPLSYVFSGKYRPNIRFMTGTWSAVLLTPLSVTGDFYNEAMAIRWGSTYRDYLLSIPPGPIAQLMGYERPITKDNSPAWEMRYGIGGTHAMVIPYMNFKSFGVFFILMLWGVLIGLAEYKARSSDSKWQLLYLCIFTVAPYWFWYGDMYMLRALMVFCLVWIMYRIFAPKAVLMRKQIKQRAEEGVYR
jgi:hypothetical protein